MSEINPSEETQKHYKVVKDLLQDLAESVDRAGSDFFVFTFPYKTAVDAFAQERLSKKTKNFTATYDLSNPTKIVQSFLNEKNINNYSFTEEMRAYTKQNADDPLYFYLDGHFTPRGHIFVANKLATILKPLIGKTDK